MNKVATPWVTLNDKRVADLSFEALDPESKLQIYKDLVHGHSIKLPNFGGVRHTVEELKWSDLDDVEKAKIRNALKGKPKKPSLTYDNESHSYKKISTAMNVIRAFRAIEAQREFSCITAPLPPDIAAEIRKWGVGNILEQDLVGDGFEEDIHTTLKYGLHSHDPFEFREIIESHEPIEIILREISIFENDKEDVVKISVDSSELIDLNKKISSIFKNTNTHSEYIPHVTIGYVKAGVGKQFVGNKSFYNRKVILEKIIFSGNDYRETSFYFKKLNGK